MTAPSDGTVTPDPSGPSRPLPRWFWPAAAFVLAVIVYLPSLSNGYTLDDVDAVERDVRLDEHSLVELLLQPYNWHVPAARSPYRPVTTLSYAVCEWLGGGDPFVYHLFNVLLHAATTLLLFGVLRRFGARPAAAGVAAVLFAVHPVHVEAVANIVGRADVLMSFFCLLAVWLWASRSVPRAARITGVCLLYLLAIGAKENGYVLPLLLLLTEAFRAPEAPGTVDGWRARFGRLFGMWPLMAAMSVTLGGYLMVRRSVLGSVFHLDVAAYMAVLPTSTRVTTAVANLLEVARLLVFPNDLSWHYGPAVILPAGPSDLRFWGGVGLVLGLVVLAARSVRGGEAGRWVLLGLGWITASFVLLSNLLVPMPMWLAERTLYLPSAGFAMLCVACMAWMGGRATFESTRRLLGPAFALVVLLAGARTWQYGQVWESNETLFTDLVERHPESFHAPWWAGQRLVDAGQLERGLVWLEQAVELNPNGVMVRLDYTRALLLDGQAARAEEMLRPVPRGLHPYVSVYLAQSLIEQDRHDEARDVVDEGLRFFPDEGLLRGQRDQLGGG